ncbi:hypothetical protein RJ640_026039 [Escallonia rubra]|uniref:RHOMBOID-like protein n=1 Tax=Escallonia rubra TaxID=112253 RepID=A0AA88S2R1_9ASTE|nr:hypothetical protein RJ640_026039 [Escallonia rubra]
MRSLPQGEANTWVISLFVIIHLIAFASTMIVNDCWRNSNGDCSLKPLGRLSFQPLPENPLLGPSANASYVVSVNQFGRRSFLFNIPDLLARKGWMEMLDQMGALRQTLFAKHQERWRLFTSPWLHSGLVHLLINLSSVIFVGIHLEQEFGPCISFLLEFNIRIGVIYIISALTGNLIAVLFLQDRPSVASSGALCGLLGAMLSGLLRNWKLYTKKCAALVALFLMLVISLALGLLPYINNFSNIGGFISGFLLGFVLLFCPQLRKMSQSEGGLFDLDVKHPVKLKQKLDRPVLRIVSLLVFSFLLAGVTLAVLHGINVNKSCSWCHYIDCIPSKWWSCSDNPVHCETIVNLGRMTLTCTGSDKFSVFPFTNVSQARKEDLCYLLCS